jgi:hypothetical protein
MLGSSRAGSQCDVGFVPPSVSSRLGGGIAVRICAIIVVSFFNAVVLGIKRAKELAGLSILPFVESLKLAATLVPVMDTIDDLAHDEFPGVTPEYVVAVGIVAIERVPEANPSRG